MLVQSRYHDSRLQWDPAAVGLREIAGTRELSQQVWTPHVYLFNERESAVMGDGKDVLLNMHHDGTVTYSKRSVRAMFKGRFSVN